MPELAAAFSRGELGIDKVVEFCRFATPETEGRLISWARRVSPGAIRHRGDSAARQRVEDVREADRDRTLGWWYFDEGRRFGVQAELPAAQGAVVASALSRLAKTMPVMPGEEHPLHVDARRADALVALASARIAEDPDADRATIVVHARVEGSGPRSGVSYEIEDGPVIHPETVRRLLCHARVQAVVQDSAGNVTGVGRMRREPTAWMLRQLRYRDSGCAFPGCGTRRFLHAHHIVWWERGGRTDLGNLTLVCSFHHKLVHEYGWRLRREPGEVGWFRPDGTRFIAGPCPPRHAAA